MNKLQAVRYAAAYTALAQKLDMHIKNFDSDPNTQTRWVWELIQNAKDAPNVFGKTKIKQELDSDYFTSCHNGDAFEIAQLHSIVAQYSTKKEKNSEETKTTGKYGTGFITTYILSKIIELSGILKVQIQELSDDEGQNFKKKQNQSDGDKDKEEDEKEYHELRKASSQKYPKHPTKQEMRKQFLETQMKILQSEFSKLSADDDDFESFQNRNHLQKKKNKNKDTKSIYYFKKFSIPMDRSYVDRDEQLPKKIEKTEKRLTKIVVQAEYESNHRPDFKVRDYYEKQRTVDSFDTIFKYKIQEKIKFQMIEKTMSNVKQLIPYAFLFNDNLHYYEFVDKRKDKKANSFAITKGDTAPIGQNIYLFTYNVEENYDEKKQKFLNERVGYFVAYYINGRAIAAVPIHVEGQAIEIIRIDPKLPRFFKDFPLIGCSDTKWNAVVNAREFYPNEKRSELMLTYVDLTNKDKVETNWKYLYYCFQGVKFIYVFLTEFAVRGLENLLILSSQNMLTALNGQFRVFMEGLVRDVALTKFIPIRDIKENFPVAPRNCFFIELAYNPAQIYNKDPKNHYQMSYRANQIFSFLYGETQTVSSGYYKAFYQVLNYQSKFREYLHTNGVMNFVSANDCLAKMEKLNFKDFCALIKTNYIDKLHQIYGFLKEYNQNLYLSISKTPHVQVKIFLSENTQFKRLVTDDMMFNSLPMVYEELAKHLKMQIKSNLIHKQFEKYIRETNNKHFMDIPKLQERIITYFKFNFISFTDKNGLVGTENLQNLFRLLLTFKSINDKTVVLLKRFVIFSNIEEFVFKSDKKDLKKLSLKIQQQLCRRFVEGLSIYFKSILIENDSFKSLLGGAKFLINYYDEGIDFLRDLLNDAFVGPTLGSTSLKLSWEGIFVKQSTLMKLAQKIQHPDWVDIQIYNIEYNKHAYNKKLEQKLIHPLYPRRSLQNVSQTTYLQLYQSVRFNYYSYSKEEKYQILTYITKIDDAHSYGTRVDATIQEKYKAWKSQIDSKMKTLFDLKYDNGEFKDKQVKDFMYKLMDDPVQLQAALTIFQNNSNALFFKDLSHQLGLDNHEPKMTSSKEQAKKK